MSLIYLTHGSNQRGTRNTRQPQTLVKTKLILSRANRLTLASAVEAQMIGPRSRSLGVLSLVSGSACGVGVREYVVIGQVISYMVIRRTADGSPQIL